MSNPGYKKEIADFIKANSEEYTNRQLSEFIEKKFGVTITNVALQSWKKRRGIKSTRKYVGGNVYLDWELDLIAWFCPYMTDKELSDWFLLVWDRDRSEGSIHSVRGKYGISTGRTGYWQDKGHERMKKWTYLFSRSVKKPSTCFKPGCTPLNKKELGTERLNGDGYYEVKVDSKRGWQYRARLVWEQANGPIPKGQCILHIDGDKTNDSLDNLVLVTKEERLQVVARIKMIEGEKDFNQAVINLAKLQCKEAEYARISEES